MPRELHLSDNQGSKSKNLCFQAILYFPFSFRLLACEGNHKWISE